MEKPKSPEKLRAYLFHGVNFDETSGKQAIGDCPFCGREGKFGVDTETGQYNCFKCESSGNAHSFLRRLWAESDAATNDYSELARKRRLYPDTLMFWDVVRSSIMNEWMIPGYDVEGKLKQLYKYAWIDGSAKLLPTPTISHHLHGVNLYDDEKPTVYLCEGPWDGMALWEILRQYQESEEGEIAPTSNANACMLSTSNVLAVPGCKVFSREWVSLFSRKTVNLMYDSDHPKRNPKTNSLIQPAGLGGMKRVAKLLSAANKPPQEINYLRWGDGGFDPQLPSGYDLRDAFAEKEENA